MPFKYFTFLSLFFLISCGLEDAEPLRPNILFAIADDASFPHMGAYGTTWVTTPAFDRVASEGLLFTRAYTPNAKCAPSRATILTGRPSWQLEEAGNHWPHFPAKYASVMEVLGEHGYKTGFTAKGWAPGIALDATGNPRQLTGERYSDIQTTPPADFISPIDYAANFEAFLNDREADEPFIFWYGAIEPHRDYEYGAGINKGGKSLSDITEVPPFWPDTEEVRTDLLDYAYEIEYFDIHLGRMIEKLEAIGELDNTVIIVTADNGMPFPRIKGQVYEMSNHLPLAIRWGDGITQPGRTITDFISFEDFAPTFLELAGLDAVATRMQPIQGSSLTYSFESSAAGRLDLDRDYVLVGKERHDVGRPNDWGYPVRGITTDSLLYLRNFEPDRWPSGNPETGYLNCDGSPTKTVCIEARRTPETYAIWEKNLGKRPAEELYDIRVDPYCMNNLADAPEYASVKAFLAETMTTLLTEQGDPRILGNGAVFDDYVYADERTSGFYERYMAGEEIEAGWVSKTDFDNFNQ